MAHVVTVELGLGQGPFDTPSWTSLGAKVIDASIRRGRTSELDQVQPGTASVRLASESRAFDPDYSAGTYYGSLTVGTPMRIRDSDGSTTRTLFTGFIESVSHEEPLGDRTGFATFVAVDALSILATPARRYESMVLRDQPLAYWRLNERDGETTMQDSSAWARDGSYTGTPTSIDGLAAESHGGKYFPGGAYGAVDAVSWLTVGGPWSVELWCNATNVSSGSTATLLRFNATTADWFNLYAQGSSDVLLVEVVRAYANQYRSVTNALPDGVHHVVVTFDGSTITIYIDGSSNAGSTGTNTEVDAAGQEMSRVTFGEVGALGDSMQLDEVAIYDSVLTATQVSQHYKAGAYAGTELTSARVTRILDMVGWPSGLRTISTGLATVGVQSSEVDALAELRRAETAEQGLLFADASGNVVFKARNYALTAASAQTFSDAGSNSPSSTPRALGQTFLANEIAVTWDEDRLPVVRSDATSIAAHGLRRREVTSLYATREEARNLADYLLVLYATPRTRFGQITVPVAGPTGVLSTWSATTQREIGDKVTITRTPNGVGSAISGDYVVQGITWNLPVDGVSTVTLDVAAQPNVHFLTLDDATLGLVDGTNYIGL